MITRGARQRLADRARLASVAGVAVLLIASLIVSDYLRAACLLLLWTWALGSLLLRVVLPGADRSGLSGWARSTAVGVAGAILTGLVIAVLGIPLRAWSVGPAIVIELGVLVPLSGWRPSHVRAALRRAERRAGELDAQVLYVPAVALGAVALIAAFVAVPASGLRPTTAQDPSASLEFWSPTAARDTVSGARPGSLQTLWVSVEGAAGDAGAYQVDAAVTGGPAWTVGRVPPATRSLNLPVQFRVPEGACRYRLQVALTEVGAAAPLYTIAVYGGPAAGKPCVATAAAKAQRAAGTDAKRAVRGEG